MRYAIVSDLHANLNAWKTVLADLADRKVDTIICLGDIVGYGAEPVEVLELVYQRVHVALMGNHDAAVCGKIDPKLFSPRAAQAVLRHRQQLSATGRRWLARLPMVATAPDFRCVHGEFSEPAAFKYIIDPEEALASWQTVPEPLLFVGHTHDPAIHVIGASRIPHRIDACDFQLEEGKRYIVNPGSVGYPRTRECRSTYCIYDDQDKTLHFRSLPFDCEGYQASIRKAGFEEDDWMRSQGPLRTLPVLRERLSFAHPLIRSQYAKNVRQERRILTVPFARKLLLVLLAGFVCIAGGALFFFLHVWSADVDQRTPSALRIPPYELQAIAAYPLVPADKNLLPDFPQAIGAEGRIAGWHYGVDDARRQTVATGLRDHAITLRITHEGKARWMLESPLINLAAAPLKTVRMRGKIRKGDDFEGTVLFHLIAYQSGADDAVKAVSMESFEVRNTKGEAPGVASLSRQIAIPRKADYLRFRVEAEFSGTLEMEQPVVVNKPPGK